MNTSLSTLAQSPLSEDSYERATIHFARPISREVLEELFEYVARELPGQISYEASVATRVGYNRFTVPVHIPEDPLPRRVEHNVTNGSVAPYAQTIRGNYSFAILSKPDQSRLELPRTSVYTAVRFFVTPGYDHVRELPEDEIAVMDKVRGHVNAYFQKDTRYYVLEKPLFFLCEL